MPMIVVTPLSALELSIARYHPSHVVTLLSPEHMIETAQGFAADRHLRLGMNDVAEEWESDCAPCAGHVRSLIDFGHSWRAEAPILWARSRTSNSVAPRSWPSALAANSRASWRRSSASPI